MTESRAARLGDFWWFDRGSSGLTAHQRILLGEAQAILREAETRARRICDRAGLVAWLDNDGNDKTFHGHPHGQRRPLSLGRPIMVALRMPANELARVDRTAALLNMSRSEVIRGAVRYGIESYERSA